MASEKKVGKYEILGELGKGAMGMVYRARDVRLGRLVALKTMLENVEKDEDLIKRFNIEAQAAAQLNHENIITIYDLGEEGDIYYIAMEFLEGEDLKSVLQKKKLTLQEKLNIILQVCMGLEYAHRMGVVHRDVKPANVMILGTGKIKLMDFGIAHMASSDMTRTGMIIGTPDYMSPEQVMGKRIDNRSDIFSVGVIFYEMMTGRKPFSSDSVTSILYKIAHESLPSLDELGVEIPIEIEAIINKAVEKEPEKRYQSMSEMIKDLKAVIELFGEQKMATQPSLHLEVKKLIEEGKAFMKAKKFQNAAEVYNKALSLDPDNSVLKRLLEKVEAELIKTKKADVDGILKKSEQLAAERKFAEALKVAESSFEILPDNTTAKLLITKIQSQAAEYDKQRLFANQEKKVRTLIKDGKFSDALKEIQMLDKIEPDNKMSAQLIAEINACKAADEDNQQIKMILGYVQENIRKGNYVEAKKSISAALNIDPKNKESLELKDRIEKLIAREQKELEKKTVKVPAKPSEVATVADREYAAARSGKAAPAADVEKTYSATVLDVPEEAPTIAATKYIPPEKHFPPHKPPAAAEPKKRRSVVPIIVGGTVAIVIAAAALLYLFVFKKAEPSGGEAGLIAGKGNVLLNVLPWANIESIVDQNKKPVQLEEATAPCSLSLPAGTYTVTLFNPELNIRKTISLKIDDNKQNNVIEKMVDWDAEELMKELKLE